MSTPNIPDANAAMAQSRLGRPAPNGQESAPSTRSGIDFEIGPRVAWSLACTSYEREPHDPVFRPLRIYALDPTASVLDGALSVVNVPYERVEIGPRGPRGSILEIISESSTEGEAAAALDLNDRHLLLQQGRAQAPEDPLFHQQMVYAVCMTTYAAFRQALGRDVTWGFRHQGARQDGARLRIRPAVSDLENAFYDRSRGELSFGTFRAGGTVAGRNVPGGRISLCLSHDIVVHEMSHALLDGLRAHFLFPSNLDVLAFHEAFADLIAIFQRFTYRDVVLAAIRRSHGKVQFAELLTSIGVQFAQATSCAGSLRSAVGNTDRRYEDTIEPHNRGEILVNAVFEAFATVFARRTDSLLRLATDGTGRLPPGEIPEILATQLAERAARLASQFLTICIRAIDYCPPVDITFGEFLRAVITADADVVPHDEFGYREAWIDAFAKRHIYPADVPSLSESALRWRGPETTLPPAQELSFARLQFDGDPSRAASPEEILRQAKAFGRLAVDPAYCGEFGLACPGDPLLCGDEVKPPVVQSIRTSRRVGPSGQVVFDLVAEITQRRLVKSEDGSPGFEFFGGATVILDPKGRVRLVIRKSVSDPDRLRSQREFLQCSGKEYFAPGPGNALLPQSKLLLRVHESTRPASQTTHTTRALVTGLATSASLGAGQYLLRKGSNSPAVSLLKACLNRCVRPEPHLDAAPVFDGSTDAAVNTLQATCGIAADGVVGPVTWTAIARLLNYDSEGLPVEGVPDWLRRLLANNPLSTPFTGLDEAEALEIYQLSYGPLTPSQREGFSFLITSMAQDTQLTNLRWAAYMLATVKHECAETWRPIEEYGRGKGRPYGVAESMIDDHGVSYENTYYGRGYVQLTWKENYQKMGQALGMGDRLVFHPELALDPATAYAILSYGMRNGSFTGVRLGDCIDAQVTDYGKARAIINGTDQASRIASYARQMETLLVASVSGARPT